MKNKTRFLSLFLSLSLLIGVGGLLGGRAGAAEPSSPSVSETAEPRLTQAPLAVTSPAGAESAPASPAEPLSAMLSRILRENAGEIFAAASFLLTLLLALLFRSGVLPKLVSLGKALLGRGEETVAILGEYRDRFGTEAQELLSGCRALTEAAGGSLARLEELQTRLEGEGDARRRLDAMLAVQSTLLYELLMSANLPQYQKERIGAAYNALLADKAPQDGEGSHE